jgi:serine O-acetyltransferase
MSAPLPGRGGKSGPAATPAVADYASVPLVAAVRADMAELARVKGTPYPTLRGRVDVIGLPGFWAVVLWRVANALHERGLRPLSRLVHVVDLVLFGAELQPGCTVGPGVVMPHPVGVCIGHGTTIGARCRIMRGVGLGGASDPGRPGHPVVGDDVWLMDRSCVLGPVRIGDRSIVGALALVTRDVEPDVFVFGPRPASATRPLDELGLADHAARPAPEPGPPRAAVG